ncbi:glycosyltransferase family 4 protein [Salegentibacter agarivorans]
MKIIQLIQKPQLRGAEIFACQLSNHLIDKGAEVIVVSIFTGDSDLPFRGKLISLDRPLAKRFTDVRGWREFSEIIKDFQPDIIQANAADTLKFAISSKLFFNWKVPVVFRNANKMGDFIDSKLKLILNKFYISKLDYVISVSKECEKDFIQTFKYPSEKISTVYIGVENIQNSEIPGDLIKIFDRGRVVTHIGGFVPEKNHSGLIDIFYKTLERSPDAQLLLIGKGRLENEIKNKVNLLKIQNNVHFLGYRKDVPDILYHSDVFVLPSLIEGLPAVILEAMYSRTPVIAYNVGGVGEVVITNKTGWLVKKGDEKEFMSHLEHVLSNKNEIKMRVDTAKKLIDKEFLNSEIADGFITCYKNLG